MTQLTRVIGLPHATAIVVGIIAGASVFAQSAGPPWPMYRGNPQHTGYVPVTLDPSRFSLRWQHSPATGLFVQGLAAAEGKVFVAWRSGYPAYLARLMSVDAATGRILWDRDLGTHVFIGTPSYAYGNVYLETEPGFDRYLRAYNATTGAPVFQTQRATLSAYSPTVMNGLVYMPWEHGLSAFDAFTGNPRWFAPAGVPSDGLWTPAVDATRAYSYVGSRDSGRGPAGLYVADAGSGAPAFMIEDPSFRPYAFAGLNVAPVLGGADDVLVLHHDRLISFDIVNRRIRWQVQDRFTGQPAVARGMVYALNGGRGERFRDGTSLNARDETTGAPLWEWRAPAGTLIWNPIITDSHALVTAENGTYAIDLSTRRVAWSIPGGVLALAEGILYIAEGDRLFAIDTVTPAGDPRPDIKVNGLDGPVTLQQGQPLAITLSLDPAGRNGQAADWWVYAHSPGPAYGPPRPTYWFTVSHGWLRSNLPLRAYDGPLTRLQGYDVGQTATLPPGRYDFFFGIDDADGVFSGRFFDTVTVTVQ